MAIRPIDWDNGVTIGLILGLMVGYGHLSGLKFEELGLCDSDKAKVQGLWKKSLKDAVVFALLAALLGFCLGAFGNSRRCISEDNFGCSEYEDQ